MIQENKNYLAKLPSPEPKKKKFFVCAKVYIQLVLQLDPYHLTCHKIWLVSWLVFVKISLVHLTDMTQKSITSKLIRHHRSQFLIWYIINNNV